MHFGLQQREGLDSLLSNQAYQDSSNPSQVDSSKEDTTMYDDLASNTSKKIGPAVYRSQAYRDTSNSNKVDSNKEDSQHMTTLTSGNSTCWTLFSNWAYRDTSSTNQVDSNKEDSEARNPGREEAPQPALGEEGDNGGGK